MDRFTPRTLTLRGRVLVAAEVADVFPLFSPEGEKLWVPGWDPEFLDPPEPGWERGQIFRTREETGEAVWIVTRLDRAEHRAEYHRVEPGRYVARVTVDCRPLPDRRTEASIGYSYVGLSESGNREIAAMTEHAYDAKLSRWTDWIARHLAAREREAEA